MITKNKIALLVVFCAVLGFGWYLSIHQKPETSIPSPSETLSPSPSPSSKITPLSKPSGKDLQSLTPQEVEHLLGGGYKTVPYSQLTKPATCNIQGSINFITPNTAANYGPKISYTGIDSPARQIKWKVTPADDLKVGPNLDVSLKLPDGESPVSVTLPSSPVSKNYSLTVSMTYGRLVGDGIRVYEVDCSGQIKVTLSY